MGSLVNSGFIGMLTDSCSFLAYTRHEYFRRILCNQLGEWADNGVTVMEDEQLGGLVQNICYNHAVRYFDISKSVKLYVNATIRAPATQSALWGLPFC